MAKTFDTIQEDTIAAIIYSRFELAVSLDNSPAFMPPPLNLVAFALMLIIYVVDILCDDIFLSIPRCFVNLCNDDEVAFDFAVLLMPPFMKKRNLEIDEQIEGTEIEISTNKGLQLCEVEEYDPVRAHHKVKFKQKVSVGNNVVEKSKWNVDLIELEKEGFIKFKQLERNVDNKWTANAHEEMFEKGIEKSPYYICGYCRGYVKASKVSLKKLSYQLNVKDIELKLINKVAPIVCPNCFRVRFERQRYELIWEIASLWIYYIMVAPLLFFVFGSIRIFQLYICHPSIVYNKMELQCRKLSREALKNSYVEGQMLRIKDKYDDKAKWKTGVVVDVSGGCYAKCCCCCPNKTRKLKIRYENNTNFYAYNFRSGFKKCCQTVTCKKKKRKYR
eukprot:423824_1